MTPAISAALAAGVLYLAGVRRLARRRSASASGTGRGGGRRAVRAWPARRTAAFVAGVAILAGSVGGLGARAEALLSAHVVEHLLMTMVAAPLLVAGAPAALALRALEGRPRARLAELVRSGTARTLTRPIVTWSLFAGATVGSHLPPVYEAAVRSAPLHAFEHMLLLATAVLFWLPLVGANPVRHRLSAVGGILYLLAAMVPMTAVGVALGASTTVRYPVHLEAARELGISALADQRAGGTMLWIGGTLLLVVAVLGLGMRALLREERREVARERYAGAAPVSPVVPTPEALARTPADLARRASVAGTGRGS